MGIFLLDLVLVGDLFVGVLVLGLLLVVLYLIYVMVVGVKLGKLDDVVMNIDVIVIVFVIEELE